MLTSLLGWYITEHYANTYDVVIVFIVIQYHAVMHTAYIYAAGKMYQGYVTRQPQSEEPIVNWHTGEPVDETPPMRDPGFIPLTRKVVKTEPVLQQVVSAPRFDKERNFAVVLCVAHDHFPEKDADMTEEKWVKGKTFTRAGRKVMRDTFTRAEFKSMLKVWEEYRLIRRKSEKKNAPYVVESWAAVRLVASGNPLPPPPR